MSFFGSEKFRIAFAFTFVFILLIGLSLLLVELIGGPGSVVSVSPEVQKEDTFLLGIGVLACLACMVAIVMHVVHKA